MKTPTHVAINYLISQKWPMKKALQRSFLLGGAAPDVPILLLFCTVGLLYPDGVVDQFSALYDYNLWVVGIHNLLHSPVSLLLLWIINLFFLGNRNAFNFFLLGCLSHSVVDVYTHVNDGPLLLWLFHWQATFVSPLSHWNPDYLASYVLIVEGGIILLAIVYWLAKRIVAGTGLGYLP
mgnify:FL=1